MINLSTVYSDKMVPVLPGIFYFDHVVSAGISILVWILSVLYFDHIVSADISTLVWMLFVLYCDHVVCTSIST